MSAHVFVNIRGTAISTEADHAQLMRRPGQRWHTTTFRWLSAYAAIFSVSFMVLVGFLEYTTTSAMEYEADGGIRWQLRYFDSKSDTQLDALIDARLEHERSHTDYYGLFTSGGERILGDIAALPPGLPLDQAGRGQSQARGRTVAPAADQPILRAIGERRDDGRILVVARSLSDVRHVRDELTKTLIGGGALCLTLSLAVGLLLSLRQMHRVADIRRVTTCIADGEIALRLAVGGRDELDMLAHLVNHMLDEVERLMNEVKHTCDGVAHDLRTPLVQLRLQLVRLAERAQVSTYAPAAALLDRARVEVDSILERFAAMLRVSELGALKRRGGFAAVSLDALVSQLYELYEPVAQQKSVHLRLHIEAVEPIHADRGLLLEAFSNLLDNAIKFAPVNGDVTVELTSCREGPRIAIADNGPGIPVGERAAVLSRFYRAEQTRHVPGTGLGLGIVSAIVRLHDFAFRIGGARTGTIVTIDCWARKLQ